MRIRIRVKANAKQQRIEKINDVDFAVWVRQQAKQGQANQGVIELLSRYFDIPKSRVSIVSGHASKHKVVEVG